MILSGRFIVLLLMPLLIHTAPLQYAAFDSAGATSMYSTGNLAGAPAFSAEQALSGGSGYWCSSGSHSAGQSVTWTGNLNSRRVAVGIKVDWAYAPGEVKILTSSDGANFEEAKCWEACARKEVAFEESFMFSAPQSVQAVAISMRGSQSWGYFGINAVSVIAQPGPFMLVSGITSALGEQCVVAASPGIALEPCTQAIAAGDGREVLEADDAGQIVSAAGDACLTLLDGVTIGGGELVLDTCNAAAEATDGRAVFSMTASGQLKMPRLGNYCVTMVGDSASVSDAVPGASVAATSTSAQHPVIHVADGDARSYWASAFDPTGPVDVQFDFGTEKRISAIVIDWEHPAQAYEIQVSSAGKWRSISSASGNNLQTTKYMGPAVSGTALRIRMTTPHPTLGNSGGQSVYAIKSVQISASSLRAAVQDCAEAEDNTDARDKFFMVAVPEFSPTTAAVAKQQASLLSAAEEHLGKLLAELYVAMPSLAACGFKASFAKQHFAQMLSKQRASNSFRGGSKPDACAEAVLAVAPAMGLDMGAMKQVISSMGATLSAISR